MTNILIVEDTITDVQFYKDAIIPNDKVKLLFAKSGEEALRIIEAVDIDIFFFDVKLPGIDGFQLAKRIREIPKYALTYIVFITGYSENQLEVFKELHCYDYIVKPFCVEEFAAKTVSLINKVSSQKKEPKKNKIVFLPTCSGDYLIQADEILFAEIRRNDCYVYLEKEVLRLLGVSLKNLIDNVNDEYFLRCHKSFAVNVNKIYSIKEVNYRLWQISFRDNNEVIDVGSKYYNSVMTKYKLIAID